MRQEQLKEQKIREQQTYIWYGYAYFEKAIVHYSNYEWLYPIKKVS